MNYYLDNSDTYYLESEYWSEERDFLKNNQCRLLNRDEANEFNLSNFFKKNDTDIKPILRRYFEYFILPYELDDYIDSDLTTDEVIIKLISENLKNNIYIASTDKDKCCFIECRLPITEDIIYNLYRSHINTPFIIFDTDEKFFVLIDFDLPIQIIGYKDSVIDGNNFISNQMGQSGWSDLFSRYRSYVNLKNIFINYYEPLIKKS